MHIDLAVALFSVGYLPPVPVMGSEYGVFVPSTLSS